MRKVATCNVCQNTIYLVKTRTTADSQKWVANPNNKRSTLLSPRQTAVLAMLAQGHTAKRIAAEIGVTTRTAEFHIAKLREKLQAQNVADAVVIAIRRGLILVSKEGDMRCE